MKINGAGDQVGERITAGTHPAVLAAVYDLGVRQHPKFGPRHECCLWWETGTRDSQGRQFGVRDVVGANLSPKGWLAKRVAALLGRPLTQEEVRAGVDLGVLVGRGCLITLEAPRTNPAGYPLVVGAVPLMPGMAAPVAEGDYSVPPGFVRRVLEGGGAAAPQPTQQPQARPAAAPQAPATGAPGVAQARPAPAPAAPPPAPQQAPSLPPGWRVGGTQDGRTWYVRPDGATTWDAPSAATRAPAPPPAQRQPGEDDVPF